MLISLVKYLSKKKVTSIELSGPISSGSVYPLIFCQGLVHESNVKCIDLSDLLHMFV